MNENRFMSVGDVFMCNLLEDNGNIQSGERLVIIIDNPKACAYSPLIHYVPLTSQDKNNFPLHYTLPKEKYQYLDFDSIALCEQYNLLNKYSLGKKIGKIDIGDIFEIVEKCKMNLPF